jgi:ferrous iron transport protein A
MVSPVFFVTNRYHAAQGVLSLGLPFISGYKCPMTLLNAPQGQWLKVTALSGGRGLRARLTQYGVFEGDSLRVLRVAPLHGPLLVEINGREIALGRRVADKILVEAGACGSR